MSDALKEAPETDYTVIGAGIIGLTVAHALLEKRPSASVSIFEKEPDIGYHASGRNSGVVHSGIYYKPGTHKAVLCVEGARRLKEFALRHEIPYRQAGKLILAASEEERGALEVLCANAAGNGVTAHSLTSREILAREPFAQSTFGGLHVPETGVIDSPRVLATLKELLTQKGVRFYFGEKVEQVVHEGRRREIRTTRFRHPFSFAFNCAGAYADAVAKMFGVGLDYVLIPFKGIYYELSPEQDSLVKESLYPVPDLRFPFLGVHLTRNVHGKVYVGPTAIPALGRENYRGLEGFAWSELGETISEMIGLYRSSEGFRRLAMNELRKYSKSIFHEMARRLVPSLRKEDLIPSRKVGIRPQLANSKTKMLELDFLFEKTPSSYHVLNSISPAFTSSFAVAEKIVREVS